MSDLVWAEGLNDTFFHCPLKTATENITIHISSSFKKAQQLCFGPKLLVCVWLINLEAFPIFPTDFVPGSD